MPKPRPIQINISSPCSQPWEQMTPDGQGRHCAHCSKTVVDFTTWSDGALYNFFSQNTDRVCGRFFATQLARPLYIPPQPHSRLYRMTIALGLTLIFTQATEVVAQNRVPMTVKSYGKSNISEKTADWLTGEIRGRITDEQAGPMPGATVIVYIDGSYEAYVNTDTNGDYRIGNLKEGSYEMLVTAIGYENHKTTVYLARQDSFAIANIAMKLICNTSNHKRNEGMIVHLGETTSSPPPVTDERKKEIELDRNTPTKKTIRAK
ncbi:MAG: carboxypeptidase-like regulatory domain-containing protein [Taibaiella sp.]|nr:carboxypeptidase-like regulatory domain-containing protein [Taibaiella sp.]